MYNDGGVCGYGHDVNYDCGVRPAFLLKNLKSSNLKIGDVIEVAGIEAVVISDDTALTKEPVGQTVFREDWRADNANNYEASDVKRWLEDWWQEQQIGEQQTTEQQISILKEKRYEDLTFTDDFIFCKILEDDKELCKKLLETILCKQLSEIEVTERQKDIKNYPDSHGVRLDIYAKDHEGNVFNAEMQTGVKRDLPLRARYYQSTIDQGLLKEGKIYTELGQTYVIFICTYDPFGYGKPIYTFNTRCEEVSELSSPDKRTTVIVNATGRLEGLNTEQANLLRYISNPESREDAFTQEIDRAVQKARTNSEWRRYWMTWELALKEAKMEAIAEGKMTEIFESVQDGDYSIERGAQKLGLSVEDFCRQMKTKGFKIPTSE